MLKGASMSKVAILVLRLVLAVIIIINGQNFVLTPWLHHSLNYGTWPRLFGIFAFCLSFLWDVEGGWESWKEVGMAGVATLLLTLIIRPAPEVPTGYDNDKNSFW